MFLKMYISEFRKEYNVQPSEVIALRTWNDSSHFYLDGVVIYGNEIVEKSDMIICREAADNFLYKSRGEKLERRADKSIDYDDVLSFRLCFHNDRTVCDLYSYEICPQYGIPALSRVEKRFHKGVKGVDPDCNNQFSSGDVEEPVSCEKWTELRGLLIDEIHVCPLKVVDDYYKFNN